MLISRTPGRISFFGGGTDHSEFFLDNGTLIIGGALASYSYITASYNSPFLGYKTHLAYSEIETVNDHKEIRHNVIRACLNHLKFTDGVSLTHISDLPSKTGIGSSSTFVVCLLHALTALQGRIMSKAELADNAIYIEREILQDVVGFQDQIWAAYGGINTIEFAAQTGYYNVSPLCLSADFITELEQSLVLMYTGISRSSSNVAKTIVPNIEKNIQKFHRIKELAHKGKEALEYQNIAAVGSLIGESWIEKKETGNVSNPKLDEIYQSAILNGAYGGKLIGAGGGGFFLFVIPAARRKHFIEKFKDFLIVPVKFDHFGSTILYYQP